MKPLMIRQPLTKREFDIMTILWEADKPLIASEIVTISNEITINTVQAVLKKLLQYKYIKIDEIVYSGKVLTRSYIPLLTPEEYQLNYISSLFKNLSDVPNAAANFVSTLLDSEMDAQQLLSEIEQLEQVIMKKKQQLTKN
ncbi:MAG: BlaI/MecI/CopY family transcriptional regulator [Lachnospiraceae bacterium]